MRRFIGFTTTLLLAVFTAGCTDSEPTAETTVPSEPVEATSVSFANTQCPIMGGEPTEELTRTYQDKTIGFCCDGCPQKWDALSDEEKAEKFAKVNAAAEDPASDSEE